jgi:DNA-binding IscR family transcriptional regulator
VRLSMTEVRDAMAEILDNMTLAQFIDSEQKQLEAEAAGATSTNSPLYSDAV